MTVSAPTAQRPTVLFVCTKSGGKSQMAAGLMTRAAGDTVTVTSAGTEPGSALNGCPPSPGRNVTSTSPARSPGR